MLYYQLASEVFCSGKIHHNVLIPCNTIRSIIEGTKRQDWQYTYIVILRHFHCRGRTKCYTFPVYLCSLSYPAYNAHTPYYIVICCLPGCTVFFSLSHKRYSSSYDVTHPLSYSCSCSLQL